MTSLSKKEILRYLGFRGKPADAQTADKIETVSAELLAAARPKSVYRRYPVEFTENAVLLDGARIESVKLRRHLTGCTAAYLFAATLGVEADSFIRRCTVTDMAAAAVAQACCAAMIEAYCDEQQAEIAALEAEGGLSLKPRFSPGYGDFALDFQRALFARLMPEKRIGLTLSPTLLMVPMKSVSAIIGVTASPACSYKKCRGCENTECTFREDAE